MCTCWGDCALPLPAVIAVFLSRACGLRLVPTLPR